MEKDRFLIVKDFYKIGSILLEYDKSTHRQYVGDANTLRVVERSPIQVVILGGKNAPDVYGEYKPYFKYDISRIDEVINMVINKSVPGEPNEFIDDNPYIKRDEGSNINCKKNR